MKQVSTLGIDLAKTTFQLHGSDQTGRKLFSKKVKRCDLFRVIEKLNKSGDFMVAMEACGGSHHIARKLKSKGIDARLIAAQFVKPFVKGGNKNDAIDAGAIAEASRRPHMRFVGIKTVRHQDIQSIHRVREGLIKRRTSIANEIRGHLLERGITVSRGILNLKSHMPFILDDADNGLNDEFRDLLKFLYEELLRCFQQVDRLEGQLKGIYDKDADCQRLGEIPGVGVITSTAVVSSVGDASVFKNGRQFSAWLGLVPRQFSTGGETRLLGITKRGDRYIRKNLVHGCRSVVNHTRGKSNLSRLGQWIKSKLELKGTNKTSVALANRTARVIWVLLSRKEVYKEVS